MNATKTSKLDRIAEGVDLAIDFLTLGQYGLEPAEPTSARDAGCEGGGSRNRGGRREALPPARARGGHSDLPAWVLAAGRC